MSTMTLRTDEASMDVLPLFSAEKNLQAMQSSHMRSPPAFIQNSLNNANRPPLFPSSYLDAARNAAATRTTRNCFPKVKASTIPYGGYYGGVVFDTVTGSWVPCFFTTSRGHIAQEQGSRGAFCADPSYSRVVRATGRLHNPSGYPESGFWVGPNWFLTVLHFTTFPGPPGVDEMSLYHNKDKWPLWVSTEIINELGVFDDPSARRVILRHYDVAQDLALFEAVEGDPVTDWVPVETIIEGWELGQLSVLDKEHWVVAFGYNRVPGTDLLQWKENYIMLFKHMLGPECLTEPNYYRLLQHEYGEERQKRSRDHYEAVTNTEVSG
ncbi:hypothetical protein BDZ91DRAFT_244527 [Kalaharituber pfeilii]|nr:hypothetical protein BDZ91DRAFT_244527 [Kalaharituber pfeilii]